MTSVTEARSSPPRRPLLHPRRRGLVLVGSLLSSAGAVVYVVVTSWLLFDLTGSSAVVGSLAAALQLPAVILTLPAGILADHRDRRRLVIETQACVACGMLLLAALVSAGHGSVPVLLATAVVVGTAGAFGGPVWFAYLGTLLDDDELMMGSSLVSIAANTAASIGPLIGALLLRLIGAGAAYTVTGASFVMMIVAVLAVPVSRPTSTPFHGLGAAAREVIQFARTSPTARRLLPAVAAVAAFGTGLPALLPAFTSTVLHGTSSSYGVLLAAWGFGGLMGSVVMGALAKRIAKRHLMVTGSLAVGLGAIALATATTSEVAILALVLISGGQAVATIVARALLQLDAPAELQGRMMSLWLSAVLGVGAAGGLALGWAADRFGVPATLRSGALYACGLSAVLAMGAYVRRDVVGDEVPTSSAIAPGG